MLALGVHRDTQVSFLGITAYVLCKNIESINSDLKDEKTFRIELVIAVRDRLHLASVIKHLRKVPNILSIHRRK